MLIFKKKKKNSQWIGECQLVKGPAMWKLHCYCTESTAAPAARKLY